MVQKEGARRGCAHSSSAECRGCVGSGKVVVRRRKLGPLQAFCMQVSCCSPAKASVSGIEVRYCSSANCVRILVVRSNDEQVDKKPRLFMLNFPLWSGAATQMCCKQRHRTLTPGTDTFVFAL